MREIDPLICGYSHLKDKAREAEALKALQRIASLVKPIMRQRGWRVGTLREFYPPERNLLGINWNRGQEICLRLRYPGDERQFIPLEQVVDTMLHELSHIVHNEHDAKFHALWQQLRDEHEQLARQGYTGEGFLSHGHKLGGRRIPMDEARRRARASAEKRRVHGRGSGQRLGGMAMGRGADMRQLIADAAQRRTAVMKGCGSTSGANETQAIVEQATRSGFGTQAEEDDANERAIVEAYIELLQEEEKERWGEGYEPASAQNPSGSRSSTAAAGSSVPRAYFISDDDDNDNAAEEPASSAAARAAKTISSAKPTNPKKRPPSSSSSASSQSPSSASLSSIPPSLPPTEAQPAPLTQPRPPSLSPPPPKEWPCPICTLQNRRDHLCCDACGTERSEDITRKLATAATAAAARLGRQASSPAKIRRQAGPSTTEAGRPVSSATLDFWICHRCDAVVEARWWTCAGCGTVKLSS
ncbi:MAG: hypothetical protein M1826_005761 [Phylliscum demangeonii]|nr:MAG: hypothetical protein M1826_005761 [Phylliscum demangeonii]